MESKQDKDLTKGSVRGLLIQYFLPIWFGSIFQQLYVSADAAVVGHFAGKAALAAVGGTTTLLLDLSLGFFIGFAAGAAVLISQFYGSGDQKRLQISEHTAMRMAVAAGAAITILGRLLAPAMLDLLNTPPEVRPNAITYLRIYYLGAIFSLVYNMGSGILRAVGDSRRHMWFLGTTTFLNIILDVLFVAVFKMGVSGAALATVLSQLLSAVLVLSVLHTTDGIFRLEPFFAPGRLADAGIRRRIIELGLPSALQYMLYTISNLVIQARINSLGTDTAAAMAVYSKLDGLFWLTMMAFGSAMTTFVGQNYGAGRHDRVQESLREGALLSFGMTSVICAVLFGFSRQLTGIFTTDEEVTRISVQLIRFLVPTLFLYTGTELLDGMIKGQGESFVPMVITGISSCLLRCLWAICAPMLVPGLKTVALSYPVSWGISTLMFVIYYRYFNKKHTRAAVAPVK